MDAAKVIAVAATNDTPLREFAGYHRIARAGLPLVCIPTNGRHRQRSDQGRRHHGHRARRENDDARRSPAGARGAGGL